MATLEQRQSWERTLMELGERQREVMILLHNEPRGLSAWQMANRLNRYVHAVRPRITELRDRGLIHQVTERYVLETDRHEAVWAIKDMDRNGQMNLPIGG